MTECQRPDEYSAITDNNVYTNLMAQRNLVSAADVAQRHPDRAQDLGITAEEIGASRDAAKAMVVPYDQALAVHSQAEGFTSHEIWDFEATTDEQYPLLLNFPSDVPHFSRLIWPPTLVGSVPAVGRVGDAEQVEDLPL